MNSDPEITLPINSILIAKSRLLTNSIQSNAIKRATGLGFAVGRPSQAVTTAWEGRPTGMLFPVARLTTTNGMRGSSRFIHILACLVLLFTANQSRADEPAGLNHRDKGDLAIQARGILKKYCSECHSGEAGSRGTIVVLEHPKLVADGPNPIHFVLPKNAAGSQIIQFIEDGSMPPGNRARPTTD